MAGLILLGVGCQRALPATAPASAPAPSLNLAALAPDTGLMGHYRVALDPAAMTVTLLPDRDATALGDSYLIEGANFFRGPLCSDCLQVQSVHRDGADIAVVFRVRHPYQPGNIGLPPSASNRRDLDVFDLSLVLQVDPSSVVTYTLPAMGDGLRIDPFRKFDGLTRVLENAIGEPAALPYYLVVDDSATGISTNNRFAMGADTTVTTWLHFTSQNTFQSDLYLTMGYGASATRSTRLAPVYYLPEFNQKSPWRVEVIPPPAVDGQTWKQGESTPYPVEVRVWDWQVGATVDPGLSDPASVRAASEIAGIDFEQPAFHDGVTTVTTPSSGTGTPSDPLIYIVNVPDDKMAPASNYLAAVRVRDTRTPATPVAGPTVDGLIRAEDDLSLSFSEIPAYTTWQIVTLTVVPPSATCDPITVSKVRGSRYATVGHPYTYAVDPITSPAPSHAYDWDNGQNTPGTYDDFSAADNPVAMLTWSAPGTYTVGARVTPTGCPSATTVKPLVVTVYAGGTYVDRDNLSDPSENGSWDHPYDTITEGITAAGVGGKVYIDAAASHYGLFTFASTRTLTGIDRFNRGEQPTVDMSGSFSASSVTNNTIRGLGLNSIDGSFLQLFSVSTWTFDDCRFSGSTTTNSFLAVLAMYTVTNVTFQGCEFTNIHHAAPPTSGGIRLIRPVILYSGSQDVTFRQCEFHDIGYTVPPSSAFYNGDIIDVIMSFGSVNLTVQNCLFYDVNLYETAYSGGYSYVSVTNSHTTASPLNWFNN
ncbi:MAG: right-handed parallel beta-helix repeat-containing protein, partial [bacterium]